MIFRAFFTIVIVMMLLTDSFYVKGQYARIDSLEALLKTQIPDERRVELILDLGKAYFSKDPQITLSLGKEALLLSLKTASEFHRARSNKVIGDGYLGLHVYDSAITHYQESLTIFDSLNELSFAGKVLNNLGVVHNNLGEYDQSLSSFHRALKIKESLKDSSGLAFTFNNLGYLYEKKGNNIDALDFYMRAKSILEETDDYGNLAGNLGNIGRIYAKLNDHSKALNYYLLAEEYIISSGFNILLPELYYHTAMSYYDMDSLGLAQNYVDKSKQAAKDNNDRLGEANSCFAIGLLSKKRGEHKEAAEAFQSALILYEELGDKLKIAETSNALAFSLTQLGYMEMSRVYLDKSAKLARMLNSAKLSADINLSQSAYYQEMGQTREALRYYKAYVSAHDSINSEYGLQQLIQLQRKYEKEQQEVNELQRQKAINAAELRAKEATIQLQRIVQVSVIIGLIFLLVIIYLLYHKFQENRAKSAKLQEEKASITERNAELELARNQANQINDELESVIDERTQMLQNTIKELEAYTHSVSHDLQTPIRKMANMAQLLLKDYADKIDEEGAVYLKHMDQTALHMHNLTGNLLEFSKINKQKINCTEVDMTQLAIEVKDSELSLVDAERIKIKVRRLPQAYGDGDMIRLVWTNLISNAMKFTAHLDHPKIEIGYYKEQACFYIKDNGVGFNMKYYDKIFKPFSRLHKTSEFTGTGVGLSIVRRIIEKHNGEIWADSEEGEYTIFSFTINPEVDHFSCENNSLAAEEVVS